MAYKANVGGMFGSGEYMPSAPQVDVAGAINALSNAFRTNRDSAVQRALMVAQAQREQNAARLAEAGAAANGVLPTSAAHAYVQSNNDAYDAQNGLPSAGGGAAPGTGPALATPTMPPPVSSAIPGAPAPASPRLVMPGASSNPAPAAGAPAGSSSTPDGRPMMAAPVQTTAAIASHGSRRLSTPIDLGNGYSIIPELTPAARQAEMLDARMREMEAVASGHDATKVQTTGMTQEGANSRSAAGNATRVQTTGMHEAGANARTAATTAAHLQGTAMTVSGAQQRHDTPSADAIMHIGATTGMNQTVLQARSHLSDAETADQELDQLGSTITHKGGVVGNYVAGKVVPEMQQANQAGEQFVTLVGPMLNHGRMTAQDIEQVRKTYVPQAGDTPAVIAQKSAARKQIIQSLHHQANLGLVGSQPGVTPGPGHQAVSAPPAGAGLFDDLPSAKGH